MGKKNSKYIATSSKRSGAASTTTDVYSSKLHMVQNFLLIWMDGNIDASGKDCQNSLTRLRNVVNNVNIFTQRDQCVQFLKNIDDEKAFVIVSGALGQQLVPDIHGLPQVDAIYIFCGKKSWHKQWTKEWTKVKGVYTDIKPICEALQLAAKQFNQDAMVMSFVTLDEGSSIQNQDRLDPSFMYTQIFKDILLEMKYYDKSIQDLVAYCRKGYATNSIELEIIDEFAREYQPQSSVWWYTRECFTYQMLNRALRTLHADTIITMGFFIRDLHRQIQQLHQQQVRSYQGKIFTVYRGQGLLDTEFEKLSKTKGGLMSFNNFLSTTEDRQLSLDFAERALAKPEMVGILFKMAINPSISSTPFAAVDGVSYFNMEKEVLFSMHTVFRIGEIKELDSSDRLYHVELTLTGDDDQQLRTLTKRIREETSGSGWDRLGKLLIKIGNFDEAEDLYQALLDQTSDESEKALYYHQLGYIKDDQGEYDKAFESYDKALKIYQKTLPSNHPELATSYNNIGSVYKKKKEYENALSSYEKALEIRQKTSSPDHPHVANSYNNMGEVYKNMGEYPKALLFLEKALVIYQKTLPSNHPDLATSYNNIGSVYKYKTEYSKALPFYEKALEIRQKTLPPNHPDLATSYNNIGGAYYNMANYSKALSFFERALNICQRSLPHDHPDTRNVRNSIEIVKKKL